MPIVSSTFTQDAHVQRDGSRYTIERHTDDAGKVYQVGPYLAPAKFDIRARMEQRAREIDTQVEQANADKQEREAIEAKMEIAMDDAVKAGVLTPEEVKKAGLSLPAEKGR